MSDIKRIVCASLLALLGVMFWAAAHLQTSYDRSDLADLENRFALALLLLAAAIALVPLFIPGARKKKSSAHPAPPAAPPPATPRHEDKHG
jgi:hypothetical protein